MVRGCMMKGGLCMVKGGGYVVKEACMVKGGMCGEGSMRGEGGCVW